MPTTEYPVSVHFEGPGLKTDGLPIGELGEALIAIQRVIYKAYLIQNKEEDFFHTAITDEERQKYALQIAKRKHGSEFIILNWLKDTVQNPVVQEKLAKILTVISGAALTYVENSVRDKLQKFRVGKANSDADELALRMYPEIQEIVKHIGNPVVEKPPRAKPGDRKKVKRTPKPRVDSISISIAGMKRPIVFDEKVKENVRRMENSIRYGQQQTIVGKVDKAHVLKSKCIEALIGEKQFWVKMCLYQAEPGKKKTKKVQAKENKARSMLSNVLKHLANRKRTNEFKFTGRPIYRLGRSMSWYNEFEVEKIEPGQVPAKRQHKKKAYAQTGKALVIKPGSTRKRLKARAVKKAIT